MKLINEIIDALSSDDVSLTEALLKTKVLLHKIGHQELVEWVNNELNGYPEDETVPSYRILPAHVLANFANLGYQYKAHPIPLGHLKKEYRNSLKNIKSRESLAVLENYAARKNGVLGCPIPIEANIKLGEGLDGGFIIQHAWSQIQIADISQITIQVRSRLLDFILGLKDKLGEDLPESEIIKRTNSIDASNLFNKAIFGDNTTIIVGNNNTQSVANINVVGDFNALSDILRKNGVDEHDIASLQDAIIKDESSQEIAEKNFGPEVKEWLKHMLSKAVETSWQIELGVASSLLSTELQKYYGWILN